MKYIQELQASGQLELVNGEIWPVVIGDWHGEVVGEVIAALKRFGQIVTTSTLPSGESLPDPDCWVKRVDADPAAQISARLSASRPGDVLLVVEVPDTSVAADLMIKAELYGAAGYPAYWGHHPGHHLRAHRAARAGLSAADRISRR